MFLALTLQLLNAQESARMALI